MRLYVGLTGPSRAGKNTVADILAALAAAHHVQVLRFGLSNEIRDELSRRGRVGIVPRVVLIETGNEIRRIHGEGELARRVVARDLNIHADSNTPTLVLIDGIRHPGEVATFRSAWSNQFTLLAVEASYRTRSTRLASREHQKGDDLSTEVETADQSIGISDCMQMADWHISNEGSLEQLRTMVKIFFDQHLKSSLCIADPLL